MAITPKGLWSALTNTPTLVNGTGTVGDIYSISETGSRSLGTGAPTIKYTAGDSIFYTAAGVWVSEHVLWSIDLAEVYGTGGGGGGMTNPMTTLGDMIAGYTAGAPIRLPIGTAGQYLQVIGGVPAWGNLTASITSINSDSTAAQTLTTGTTGTDFAIVDNGTGDHKFNLPQASGTNTGKLLNTDWTIFNNKMSNPMTVVGDIIYETSGLTAGRLPIGSASQVLTVAGGVPIWATATGFANPMITAGDMIYESSGTTVTRLPVGIAGQILTVVSGLPKWQTSTALTSPMTTKGDMIYETSGITADRLPIGTVNQALTVSSTGVPLWALISLTAGVTGTLPIANGGTGQTTAIAAFNALSPSTTPGDIIYESSGTSNTRLPIGITGQILTVQASGLPAWQTSTAFTNPMTTAGDIIYETSGTTAARLAAGGAGQVLTISGGLPTWAYITSPSGFVETISFNDIGTSIGNNTYTLELYAAYGYTINELRIIAGSGTCTAAIQINGVSVTGISAVSVTTTIAVGTATAANVVAATNKVTLVLSSTSSLNNLQGTLKYTRS